jgi:hypothetical protein
LLVPVRVARIEESVSSASSTPDESASRIEWRTE